ncbi:ThuA domain-containing protein [Sphingobium lactosutens]|uniref:ThuA domain-containing protein n=1 Tax=Sphingobium lactosutens TaxID=522773 RepID=UPI00277B560E|nr:ThuA domain-containing protein [Sphingobium lactosutens]
MTRPAIDCLFVVGGAYHDMDFARLELLKLLAENPHVRTRVFEDYPDPDIIAGADFLLSYTCDRVPQRQDQRQALIDFVERGGRWFALHGTNSILRFIEGGTVTTPDETPDFMALMGTQFVGHPPIDRYRVDVVDPAHPLVKGIEPFETVDELYLSRPCAPVETLLDCQYDGGPLGSFRQTPTEPGRHPVFYLRHLGQGAVLYLTLGHCRGPHDMRPLLDHWPSTDRCSWEEPIFYELLRRGLAWASHGPAEQGEA